MTTTIKPICSSCKRKISDQETRYYSGLGKTFCWVCWDHLWEDLKQQEIFSQKPKDMLDLG